jgi:hypothetical protein
MSVWCSCSAGCGSGGVSGVSGAWAGSSTFDPVHSRKLPHDPQKLSLLLFWKPHFEQTINGRPLDGKPACNRSERVVATPGRAAPGARSVGAW